MVIAAKLKSAGKTGGTTSSYTPKFKAKIVDITHATCSFWPAIKFSTDDASAYTASAESPAPEKCLATQH